MTKKQSKLPTDKHIIGAKEELSDYLNKVASGEITVRGNKETVTSKLELIKDVLEPLKDKEIPYSILCKILFEKTGLKVSPQTLRTFCQTRLDFPKAGRKARNMTPDEIPVVQRTETVVEKQQQENKPSRADINAVIKAAIEQKKLEIKENN